MYTGYGSRLVFGHLKPKPFARIRSNTSLHFTQRYILAVEQACEANTVHTKNIQGCRGGEGGGY